MSAPLSTPAWHTWRINPPSATPQTSTMLKNQQLPRLPVPDLDSTLDRLRTSCTPLAKDHQQLAALDDKLARFRKEGSVGRKLHKQLQQRRDDPETPSWLAQWWDEQAYMAYRDSVVVNVSYYYGFSRLPQASPSTANPPASDPAYVAASIASTALSFRRLIALGVLEPDLAGRTPADGELCMESYKWAFNACRIPAVPGDYAVKTSEDAREAQHFVVVRRGRFFSIPVVDEQGEEYGVEQIREAVKRVMDEADAKEEGPRVGVLTGINRDRWAEAYSHLSSSPTNAATLRALQTSAFVICLDSSSPQPSTAQGIVQFSKRLWTGADEGGNRWWDKPLQWVVFENGEAGFVGEHSCMDGTPTARLNDFLSKRLLAREPFPPSSSSSTAPSPLPLPFDLDATSLEHIQRAEAEFKAHIEPFEVHYLSYGRYGKDGIKAMKASPDGWVQMLFQLAYYMTFDRPTATYEAAQTRRFHLGRTETVRILTPEALAFVQTFLDPSSSRADKLATFHAALAQHGKDMKAASHGLGVDRHLFGMKMLAAALPDGERKEVLEEGLLGDELVRESGTWRMSTSQIYIRNAPAYGWGPVVADGLGLPYMIHPESLQLTVTCHRSVPGAAYLANFEKAAGMLMDLHEEAKREEKL
ncbi:hypothetical protein JCM10207_002580 [Rhodosporidiobolus poonsookiae]